jgi:glycerophosphoryl diester phosphodiesterase
MLSLLLRLIDNWRSPAPDSAKVAWLGEWEYAHRGLHSDGVPENSPGAFADAMANDLGIECDVQRTRDGRAMVFHDWELDRLTYEKGPVDRRDAADLETITLAGSTDRIPQLSRFLDQIGGRVPVLIELKSESDRGARPLCIAVRRSLEGYRGQHAVMSFDPRISRWFAQHSPKTVRGLVMTDQDKGKFGDKVRRRLAVWHAKPDFLAYDVRDFPSKFAAAQRARGLPLLTWTVRSPELRETALQHTDGLISEGEGLA